MVGSDMCLGLALQFPLFAELLQDIYRLSQEKELGGEVMHHGKGSSVD